MKYFKTLAAVLIALSTQAQNEKSIGAFTEIEVDIPVTLKLIKGNQPKVKSEANLKGYVFNNSGPTLEIDFSGEAAPASDAVIEIYFQELNKVEVNGAVTVEMDKTTPLVADKFELECNGASKANMAIDVKKLQVEANGASKITLSGKADMADVDVAGAAKLYAADLVTKETKLDAAGATYFSVHATESLQIDAAGACKGIYAGNPINRNINVSGISNIVDANTGKKLSDERESANGNDDTTRISIGKKKVIIIEDGEDITIETDKADKEDGEDSPKLGLKNVYAGFELGMGALTTNGMNFKMPTQYSFLETKLERSWFYGINLLEGDLQLVKNKLAITSGLGMEFQNLEFNTDRILTPNISTLEADSGNKALLQNRMYNFNINAPLLLKFAPRTRKNKNGFHFAAGVIGTFKAHSHVRIETTADGFEEKAKRKDDYNINPFRLTATVRMGYGWFRAFANYGLTPYFNTANGNPDIRNFSAGITLIPFDY